MNMRVLMYARNLFVRCCYDDWMTGGANRVVIGVFDMGEMDVPVVLVFVTDHG